MGVQQSHSIYKVKYVLNYLVCFNLFLASRLLEYSLAASFDLIQIHYYTCYILYLESCLTIMLVYLLIAGVVSSFGRKGILLLQPRQRQMRRYRALAL